MGPRTVGCGRRRTGLDQRACRARYIGGAPLALLLAAAWLAIASWSPPGVGAHAYLKTSDPSANAIVATAPPVVTLTFTEPLERASTWAQLLDQTGEPVSGTSVVPGADDFSMILELPAGLPNGTYTVLWHTLSTADGHPADGYIPFTIGTEEDFQIVTPPTVDSGPPVWLQTTARWAALLGLAAAVAVWPVWLFVLRPAISPAWQAGPALTRHVKRLAAAAIVAALLGSLFALLVQAAETGGMGSGGYLGDLRETLLDLRYGRLWLIRVGLILVYGAVLTVAAWWWPKREKALTAAGLLLAAALPIPFSMVAHAAAQPDGRTAAVAFDVAHLLGASLWIGGLVVLLGAFIPSLPDLTPAGRRVVLGRALPRFSALAIAAWAVMGLTGLYSAWLNVGNLEALRETAYGRSLTLKLLLIVPLLALGAVNLLVVTRAVRAAGRDQRRVLAWSRRFAAVVAAEVVLVVLLLFVVGRLTSQAPAREELALGSGRAVMELDAAGRAAKLTITPAATGTNHFRIEFSGDALPADAVATLRLRLPVQGTDPIERELTMTRALGNAFEGHGLELSIAGEWTIQALLIRPGQPDWTATRTLAVGTTPPEVDLPAPAWRFGTAGVLGLLLLAAGAAAFAVALQTGRAPLRRESLGLGTVVAAVGLILLLQARIEPTGATLGGAPSTNPIPADAASIARGQDLFLANCATCHGAGGRGDGPAAAGLTQPPADLTSSHARLHQDQDLFFWVENGIAGSAMPAFGDTLSDDEIWDVLNYIRSLQGQALASRDAPGPESCTVAPRSIESLEALAVPAPAATPEGLAAIDSAVSAGPVDVPAGQPAESQVTAEITGAVRELVACSNARDPLRRLALFTDEYIQPSFSRGPSDAFVRAVATPAVPLPETIRVAIVSIDDVQVLDDGRVRATVAVDNPTTHSHGPSGEELPGQQTLEVVTLVFERAGDRWLIDELYDVPPDRQAPQPTAPAS